MLFSRPAMCFPRVPISLNSVPTPSPTRVALCYTQTGFLDSAYCDQQMFHIWLCPALVAARGLQSVRALYLWHMGSLVVACGDQFPDQGLNPRPLHY